jgi:hypothetical protein
MRTLDFLQINKKTSKDLLEKLKKEHPAFILQSILKCNSELSILRRGKVLTFLEKLRCSLHSTNFGKFFSKLAKLEFKSMKKDPKKYIQEYNILIKIFNLKLKYELLGKLKYSSITKYKSKPILKVVISKTKDHSRSLGIPTIYDRTVQKYLQVVMEPYLEVIGDCNS